MAIRIGSSWVISPAGVDGFASEVRRHWFENPYWDYKNAIKKCIANNIYIIFTQCLGYNKTAPHPEYLPTENEWRNRIEENVKLLQSYGATKNSACISLINEPTKFFRIENGYRGVEDLIWFTNIAHDQIAGRFELGAGNMEFYDSFVLGDWYGNLNARAKFEISHIHIQNSCDTYERTKQYTDYALNLANKYGRKISCTEAMHTSWDMAGSDYTKLLVQLHHAERIGCSEFCVICLNLDTQAAAQELNLSQLGNKPCFKIDGVDRSNGHYENLINIANEKKPNPNIIPIEELDDMKLELLGLNFVKKGQQVKWLQDILLNDYQVPNPGGIDGKLGTLTDKQIRDYQEEKEIKVDGIVGEQTTMKLVNESSDPKKWFRNLQIYMAYE
jgi:hypothetical protein